MRKILAMAMVMVLLTSAILAQDRTITGKVIDDKGNPLPNVSVVVKGSTTGTASNSDGTFSISVASKSRTLIFSSIDMETKEVTITSASMISVVMSNRAQGMEEVVVVAYGTVKKGEHTGSTAQITAQEIAKRPISNAMNALVGSAPGIQTTTASGQPGSSPVIRLRGYSSYNGNRDPLIIVDGVPYDGGLSNILPDDIESISTLKDAASSALYGSRAANGAIVITTKKGKKGRNQLSFKAVQGVTSRAIPEYDKVNAFEYYPLMWESYRNTLAYRTNNPVPLDDANKIATGLFPRNGSNLQVYKGNTYSDLFQVLGYNPFMGVQNNDIVRTDGTLNPAATQMKWGNDVDWLDAFYKNGSRAEYGLSYSGATDKTDYFGSFAYTNEKGFVERSDLKRFTGRLSLNVTPVKWFKTGMNISGSSIISNYPAEGGIVNPFSFARDMGPIYPVFAHDTTSGAFLLDSYGAKVYDIGNIPGVGARPVNQGRHAVYENILNKANWKRNILSGRGYAEVIFLPELRGTVNISTDIQNYDQANYENPIVGDGAPAGRSSRTLNKVNSYTFNQLLNYNRKFGIHNVSGMVGHENYSYKYNYLTGMKIDQGFSDGNTEWPNFASVSNLTSQEDNATIESYLSKVAYDYDSKYFLTASLRRDGNSRFHESVRWDNFWSVGAAWRLDQEGFIKIAWLDQLKLRGSYGKVGNDGGLGYYPYMGLYDLGYNNGTAFGIVQASRANNSLTWESLKSIDLGVDFTLFKGRLSGSIDYYNRVTDGLIFNVPQPLSNGGTTGGVFKIPQNIGSLYNRGFEFQVTGDVVRTPAFSWSVTVNATTLKNKITKMPPTSPRIVDGTKQIEEGRSIYDYYLRHYYGVDPNTGAALYTAQTYDPASPSNFLIPNGKGGNDTVTSLISNARLMYVDKTSIPDVYGSVMNNFRYKDFDFSFVLTYQIGGWAYDNGYASLMGAGSYGYALHPDALQRWQKKGDITTMPRMEAGNTANLNAANTDRWLTSASYLSINNASIGYTVPKKLLGKITAQSARVFISGENLYLFSKRKGLMVNQNFNGTNTNVYPPARIVSAGINVTF